MEMSPINMLIVFALWLLVWGIVVSIIRYTHKDRNLFIDDHRIAIGILGGPIVWAVLLIVFAIKGFEDYLDSVL